MSTTRKDTVFKMVQENPRDEFLQYALYLEYQKDKDPKTEEQIELLLREFPSYLPTYYIAAKWFENKDEVDRALSIYEKGIALAQAQQDIKAINELGAAKMNLEFEM